MSKLKRILWGYKEPDKSKAFNEGVYAGAILMAIVICILVFIIKNLNL